MTVTLGSRTALPQWSAGTDAFTRSQMNAANAAAESNFALDSQGLNSARPAAGKRGRYYYATDTGQFYRDTGSTWVQFPTLAVTNVFTAAQSIIADGSSDQLKLDTTAASGSATLLVRRRTAADLSTWKQSQITVSANRAAFLAQANTDTANGYRNDFTGMSGRWGINWNADTAPDDTLVIKNRTGVEVGRFLESGGLSLGVGSAPVANLDVRTQSAKTPALRLGGPVVNGHEWAYTVVPTGPGSAMHMTGAVRNGDVYTARAAAVGIYEQNDNTNSWYADSGLTPGSPYTPTLRMRLGALGELFTKELWVGEAAAWGYMGMRQRASTTTALEIINSAGANAAPYIVFARSDGGFDEAARIDVARGSMRLGSSIVMDYSQRGVLGLSDIGAAFVGNAINGGFLYSDAGRLHWRGPAGTVTMLAPA